MFTHWIYSTDTRCLHLYVDCEGVNLGFYVNKPLTYGAQARRSTIISEMDYALVEFASYRLNIHKLHQPLLATNRMHDYTQ